MTDLPDLTSVIGQSTYGKTVWIKLYTRGRSRGFFYDPTATFEVDTWVDLDGLLELDDSGFFRERKHFRIGMYDPDGVDTLANIAYRDGNNTLVLEEASTIFTRNQTLPPWMRRHVFLGRHRNVQTVISAQRAATIPIDVRSQSRRVVTFRQEEPADLQWLRAKFGDRAFEASQFPPLHCMENHRGDITEYSIEDAAKRVLTPENHT